MKKIILLSLVFGIFSFLMSQPPVPPHISKIDYYNQYLAPAKGLKPLPIEKPSAFADRKRSVLNVGNLVLRFSNAATLGYDRWGLNHQFPAGSEITYYWTMAPLIGGVKKGADGTLKKSVASGTWGAARLYEGEFEPLAGYDSGLNIPDQNIGIAFSDIPESWPAVWPTDPYVDPFTGMSFNIERPLDIDVPGGKDLRFPGFVDGNVVATREAYWVVTDNDSVEGNVAENGPLDIRLDMWAIQYDDELNQDFIIFKIIMTNVGKDTIYDVYMGVHGDPDTPEQGGAEWTDDFALFFHKNYPEYMQAQIGSVDTLLYNTLIVYDADDYAEGFLNSKVGWIGFKVLETPINPATGEEFGITTMDLFPYSDAPQGDVAEYAQLTLGIEEPDNIAPHPDDENGKFPYSYGPDITFVIASGPFDLAPGEQQLMSFASILGVNKSDILNNCRLAQLLHNADYRAAQPPAEPIVRAVAEDQKVTLYWDPYPSEYSVDPLTGSTDKFEGYRIYKSTDRGKTWGDPITNVEGVVMGYVPVAIFDKENTVEGVNPMNPYLNQGNNSGLQYTFTDINVINGFEYWYAVCAFDAQDGVIPPMENSRKKTASPDDPFDDNTVAVIPRPRQSGWQPSTYRLKHDQGFSTAKVEVDILDYDAIQDNTYWIAFTDTTGELTYSVIDSSEQDTVIKNSNLLNGEGYNLAIDGMRIKITDISSLGWDPENTYWITSIPDSAQYTVQLNPATAPKAALYEVRFTERGDTSLVRGIPVPFEIWNTRENRRIDFALQNSPDDSTDEMRNTWTSGDPIQFVEEFPNDSWLLIMKSPKKMKITTSTIGDSTVYDTSYIDIGEIPHLGDTLVIGIKIPLETIDFYTLHTQSSYFSQDNLQKDISRVKVVPNPYKVTSVYETSLEVKELQFTHLPEYCSIRIYNIAGDFIREIKHSGGSIEPWNLRTYNDQEISFGIYLFVVEAYTSSGSSKPVAHYLGKFAVIK